MGVNWVELALFGLIVLLVAVGATILLLFRIDLLKARVHQDMVDFQHSFLQGEYARIANEDTLVRAEMQTLIEEVMGVAQAVRGMCDERIAALSRSEHAL